MPRLDDISDTRARFYHFQHRRWLYYAIWCRWPRMPQLPAKYAYRDCCLASYAAALHFMPTCRELFLRRPPAELLDDAGPILSFISRSGHLMAPRASRYRRLTSALEPSFGRLVYYFIQHFRASCHYSLNNLPFQYLRALIMPSSMSKCHFSLVCLYWARVGAHARVFACSVLCFAALIFRFVLFTPKLTIWFRKAVSISRFSTGCRSRPSYMYASMPLTPQWL